MSNSDDKNIDKIFNEMMSSNSIDGVSASSDPAYIVKELLHVQESLAESLLSINSIVYYMLTDPSYSVPESLGELIGPLYKISEDFIGHLIELNGTMEPEEDTENDMDDENGV